MARTIICLLSAVTAKYIAPDADGHHRVRVDEYKSDAQLTFNILGDWGGFPAPWYNTPLQTSAAKLMGQVAADLDSKFTLAIGDNFYFWGVQDVADPRWYTTWDRVYTHESLMEPWYPVGGNHDWQGNITAQLKYSSYNLRWTFPYYYYTVSYTFANDITLKLIMIDTQMLCDQNADDINKVYPWPVTEQMKVDEMEWLEQELEDSADDDYVFLVGHYQCHTHNAPKSCMKPVDALMKEHKVTAYINGHLHDQQLMQATDGTDFYYIETGTGALTDPRDKSENNNPHANVVWGYNHLIGFKGGFATMTLDSEHATVHWYYSGEQPENNYDSKTPVHTLTLNKRTK